MHTFVCVHKILESHQQGEKCRNISLSLKLLVKINTVIFRTGFINESLSCLVHIRASTLFPMKNSFVKVKEKTSWVVFKENKNRVLCFSCHLAIGYHWGPEAQEQDAVFEPNSLLRLMLGNAICFSNLILSYFLNWMKQGCCRGEVQLKVSCISSLNWL